jgi:hypothetical protein
MKKHEVIWVGGPRCGEVFEIYDATTIQYYEEEEYDKADTLNFDKIPQHISVGRSYRIIISKTTMGFRAYWSDREPSRWGET